jgi:hypothetical protein
MSDRYEEEARRLCNSHGLPYICGGSCPDGCPVCDIASAIRAAVERERERGRLAWLRANAYYTGRWACRRSVDGRGWRLHETSKDDAYDTPWEAIDAARATQGGE